MPKEDGKEEKILENWNLFVSLVKKIKDEDVRSSLLSLCDDVENRIATCPASTNTKYIGAFPGGLVWHSLEVLKIMKELNKIYDANLSSDNLIITALFHDLGKIGNKKQEYYLPQESDWHAKRGMVYEINQDLISVQPSVRSVWWLTGVTSLSEMEINAILSLRNMQQMYSSELYNSPMLTMILQQAVRAACTKNKGKESVLG